MEQGKSRLKKKFAVLFLVIILLAGIAAVIGIGLLSRKEGRTSSDGIMEYEANIIVDDAKTLQDAVDEMYRKAKEGYMTLQMQTEAYSEDGREFTCYLANAAENSYDMFMVFYRDDTQEEIYRTGLIPIGARIEEFTLEEALEPGNHEITIVYNQVEEDRETIHAQVNVGLTLIVE